MWPPARPGLIYLNLLTIYRNPFNPERYRLLYPATVIFLGLASTGYGLSSRVVAGAGYGASTLGVFLERPPADGRTASAGWYNDVALRRALSARGRYPPASTATPSPTP